MPRSRSGSGGTASADDDWLDPISTDQLARVVATLEGRRPAGKLRSCAYGIARVRRTLDRSGRTVADAPERAGVRPRGSPDGLLLPGSSLRRRLDRVLTLTNEDVAAFETSGAARARLPARHG